MISIRQRQLDNIRSLFPSLIDGENDFRHGIWREVAGHSAPFAYELGRMLAQTPPIPSRGHYALPGIMLITPEVAAAIRELESAYAYEKELLDA